ncbi:hypothetical protein AAHA92_29747 [Salvia divinorum]|uniref:Glycine-rich protein n=1 Tax=Salvia divinorum TaxID=28513 RepID=A0ABD1FZD3_SALDI
MHRVIKFVLVLTFILTSVVTRSSGGSVGAAGARGGGTRGLGGASGGGSSTVRPVRPGQSSGASIDLGIWHYFTVAYLVYASF